MSKLSGMFLNEGEKETFLIAERVLESSKREREKEREREWSSWKVLNEGDKENKRRGRDSDGHLCGGEKQEKKKEEEEEEGNETYA